MTKPLTPADLAAALPDLTSEQTLSRLRQPAEILRDPWGIPHIRAASPDDLFFTQGFATAQDRLWQMDCDRYQALGRWAELTGPDGLERDRLLRAAGMGRTARLDYAACSLAARAMLDAYAAGVNAFLEATTAWPIEYSLLGHAPEPWEPWHCLAVYKMRNTLLGTFEPKLFRTRLLARLGPEPLAQLMPGYPPGHLLTVPPGGRYTGAPLDSLAALTQAAAQARFAEETDPGSNAWVLSGKRTASGLPLVAGDSHRALDAPNVYYQVHLSCPGLHVIGYSVPGMPGALHFCHNERVAWGMTFGMADTQDLFIECFRPTADGLEYRFGDAWRPAEVETHSLQVRGGNAVSLQTVRTHHGPVVAGDPEQGHGIAIADPGLLEGTPWPDAALEAMRADSVAALDRAFAGWTDRVNNYAVADTAGHFGYLHAGKIPVRQEKNGWAAVPGWDGAHEWDGYIPHERLPRALDPACGYAVTCNHRVADADYPYYVGLYFAAEHRARRVLDRILALPPGQATAQDMGAIHADRRSLPAQVLTGHLLALDAGDARRRQALDLMGAWDFSMDRQKPQAAIYSQARAHLVQHLLEHLLGPEAQRIAAGEAGADTCARFMAQEIDLALQKDRTDLLPPGASWNSLLADVFEQALDDLSARLGPDMAAWQWGDLHRTRPRHPLSDLFPKAAAQLDPPSLPVHGDGDTPLAGSYPLTRSFTVTGTSVNRYILDPSDWNNSRWISPLGASGHPGSPHYADQAALWADVEFIPMLWDWDQIAQRAQSRQTLTPAPETP